MRWPEPWEEDEEELEEEEIGELENPLDILLGSWAGDEDEDEVAVD
jgi:hypothetical protein